MSATALVKPGPGVPPFKRVSEVVDAQGVNLVVFGYPGVGKTTLGADAADYGPAKEVLIFDLDGGLRSIVDREDVTVLQPRDWDEFIAYVEWLKSHPHPFKTFILDSLTAAQRMTLEKVMKTSPTPDTPSQPEWGKSNELVLAVVRDLKAQSKQRGWNTVFTAHAVEVKDEASGVLMIRMDITPGIVKGVYQIVDAVGYLAMDPKSGKRRLLLKETARVLAKYRQPRTGPQLPTEIDDPTMESIIKHARALGKEFGGVVADPAGEPAPADGPAKPVSVTVGPNA